MEHGSGYRLKDNKANLLNYRKLVSFDSDLIISLFARKLNKIKFNKYRIKLRAFHAIAQQQIYILYIHVMILYVRNVKKIFLLSKKSAKFVKNNLKPFYRN